MSVIPGSIPVTGFIGPTDSGDVYAVTDARYGIDGLRNEADKTARNAIPFERRRTGMIVGTQDDLKYWKLLPMGSPDWAYDDSDWDLAFDLSTGPISAAAGNISVFASLSSPAPSGSPSAYEYYGSSGSPGITSLQEATIYLVTFDTNTGGPVRLDIDGLGLLDITKASPSGPVPLDADDIAADVIYAIVYNGVNFQLLGGSSSSAEGSFIKEHLVAGDDIIVNADFQYLVYGDLTIDAGASLTNYGHIVIINGALIQNGSFDNFGTIHFVSLELEGPDSEWKDSVLSIESDSSTLTPTNGDRYLVDWETTALNDFAGHEGEIAICINDGSPLVWDFQTPDIGWAVLVDDVPGSFYRFVGPSITWVRFLAGAIGTKEHLVSGDDITVEENYEYIIYGDLTIDLGATLTNKGHIVIINGNLIQNGVFDNQGTIDFVDLLLDTGEPISEKYVEPATAYLATVVNTITHGLGAGDEIFISIVDTVLNEQIDAFINNFTTNSVNITFSQNVTAKIIIRS